MLPMALSTEHVERRAVAEPPGHFLGAMDGRLVRRASVGRRSRGLRSTPLRQGEGGSRAKCGQRQRPNAPRSARAFQRTSASAKQLIDDVGWLQPQLRPVDAHHTARHLRGPLSAQFSGSRDGPQRVPRGLATPGGGRRGTTRASDGAPWPGRTHTGRCSRSTACARTSRSPDQSDR